MIFRRFTLLLTAFLALAPATAFAASATQDGYDDNDVVDTTDSGSEPDTSSPSTATATPSATTTSSLPFTGMEAGLIAVAGLGLAGTGLMLRRAGREQQL